jgi:WD40 repeat protein
MGLSARVRPPWSWVPRRRAHEGSAGYDAFISYSHAVDRRFAPALQRALHHLAKPWYRLRALRVFRDDESLSANPHLWSSIQDALESSRFFLLLASPEAARSEWVQRELDYWRQHKSPANLLIVLTDGAIAWQSAADDFDWDQTTALPRSLEGMFGEEPRWVDFRWARTDEHLSLNDPRFRDGVADLAAPLHNRAKDELFGEDVKQHRRTTRLVRAASAVLIILSLLATAGAIVAVDQRNDARAQARLATSRFLAAESAASISTRLDRALLLSVHALTLKDTPEARAALVGALVQSPDLMAILSPPQSITSGNLTLRGDPMAISPDGLRAITTYGSKLYVWDLSGRGQVGQPTDAGEDILALAISRDAALAAGGENGAVMVIRQGAPSDSWSVRDGPASDAPASSALAFSPDGRTLAAGDRSGNVEFFDARTGDSLWAWSNSGNALQVLNLMYSSDGRRVVRVLEDGSVAARAADGTGTTSLLFNGVGGERHLTASAVSPDLSTLAIAGDFGMRLWDLMDDREIDWVFDHPSGIIRSLVFSADSSMLAAGGNNEIQLWLRAGSDDVGRHLWGEMGDPRKALGDAVSSLAFAPDGRSMLSAGAGGSVGMWDVKGKQRLTPLLGDSALAAAITADGGKAVTSGDGELELWSLDSRKPLGSVKLSGRGWAVSIDDAGGIAAVAVDDTDVELWRLGGAPQRLQRIRSPSAKVRAIDMSPDGRRLAIGRADGVVELWNVVSGDKERSLNASQDNSVSNASAEAVTFNPDGVVLAVGPKGVDHLTLWNVETGATVTTLKFFDGDPFLAFAFQISFSADGRRLAAMVNGGIAVWELADRSRIGGLFAEGEVIRDIALTRDGDILLGAMRDGLGVWDIETHRPLGARLSVRAGGAPLSSLLRLAVSRTGRVLAVDGSEHVSMWNAEPSSWVKDACRIANHTLDRSEWQRYIGSLRPYHPTCP